MNTSLLSKLGRNVLAAASLCALCGYLNIAAPAVDNQPPIDWNRTQQLFNKSRQGEQLSVEGQAYLDRAKAERAIRRDKPYNEVKRGAMASLVTAMGRMAAHTGQIITYDDMLNCEHDRLCENSETAVLENEKMVKITLGEKSNAPYVKWERRSSDFFGGGGVFTQSDEFTPTVDKLTMDGLAPLLAGANRKYPVPEPGIKTTREF